MYKDKKVIIVAKPLNVTPTDLFLSMPPLQCAPVILQKTNRGNHAGPKRSGKSVCYRTKV